MRSRWIIRGKERNAEERNVMKQRNMNEKSGRRRKVEGGEKSRKEKFGGKRKVEEGKKWRKVKSGGR